HMMQREGVYDPFKYIEYLNIKHVERYLGAFPFMTISRARAEGRPSATAGKNAQRPADEVCTLLAAPLGEADPRRALAAIGKKRSIAPDGYCTFLARLPRAPSSRPVADGNYCHVCVSQRRA